MVKFHAIVSVIGIGRVGLPFALVIANEGYKVYGIGRSKEKIALLKNGKMPFIEEGKDLLKQYINTSFFPTTTYESIRKSDVIILTLGTPIDENMNPVLNQIDSVIESILHLLRQDQLIILRSTISPNTTKYIKDTIELKTRLKVGKDIFLAFCPERIAEGKSIQEIKEIPQIIGGIDLRSTKRAKLFFESLGIECLTTDATSAELAKLFTNMYRYISFAIANEFFVIAENFDRDISEIVHLVNHGYKRNGLAIPGFSAGPCLFKDGFFLINDNPYLDLITASWKINESMPLFLVKKLKERINLKGKKVVILGVSFKAEVDDIRESLSFKLRKALLREHAEVVLHDPYVKDYKHQKVYASLSQALDGAHAVIIGTNHKLYSEKKEEIISLLKGTTYVCDIWNAFEFNKLLFTANQVKTTKKKRGV
jgi:UDP-N-acetyl-D-mannosaminuronic acid dehydrogenase